MKTKTKSPSRVLVTGIAVFLLGVCGPQRLVQAREKNSPVDPNDVTSRLFQLLDDSHDGKLTDFYVLADLYKDKNSSKPGEELQHVLLVDYDKDRNFGKLNLHVRTLDKLDPEQLKTYTPKQVYDFGDDDTEKFVKSDPGPLGRTGDMYLRATVNHPLRDTPITDEARKAYDFYLTQYVIPALQKK
ncbi:MAG: hypothetical protein ACYDA9_11010 [Terriglobia bacterium]